MSCVRANWKKKKTTITTTTTTNRERQKERVLDKNFRLLALAGNRTRAFCVTGENSTTEPPVPFDVVPSVLTKKKLLNISSVSVAVAFFFCSSITREKARRAKLNRL